MAVTDKNGLVNDNELLVVYMPNSNKAMVYRVITRQNRGFERIDYGGLPTTAGQVLNTYDGSTNAVGYAGELPARAYTSRCHIPRIRDMGYNRHVVRTLHME